mgnify:CR=1 FL=1
MLNAESESSLRTLLRRDNVILIRAREKAGQEKDQFNPRRKVKPLQIVIFTRQLATMITSGLPLVQSLAILSNQLEDKNLKIIVTDVKEKIEGGSRFADALKQYPKVFDSLYVNLVVAGEEGGNLDTVLQRLAVYMEKVEKLKKKVKSAMIYPISILVVAVGVVGVPRVGVADGVGVGVGVAGIAGSPGLGVTCTCQSRAVSLSGTPSIRARDWPESTALQGGSKMSLFVP